MCSSHQTALGPGQPVGIFHVGQTRGAEEAARIGNSREGGGLDAMVTRQAS